MRASLRRRVAMIIGVATLAASVAVVAAPSVALAADVIINVPTTFAAADASDGASDGTFTVTGNLTITSAGAVTCNDPASPPNADACDIDIAVGGEEHVRRPHQGQRRRWHPDRWRLQYPD